MSAVTTLAGRAVSRPARKGTASLEVQRRRYFWPFVAPALVVYVAFFVAPALFGLYASLTKWGGAGTEMEFIGIGNFLRLTRDPYFHQAFLNTMAIAFVCGACVFVIAFAFAVVVREMRRKVTIRSLLFLPYLISPIAMGIAFGLLLAPKGAVNTILRALGLGFAAIEWLGPDNEFRTIMIGIVWVNVGFFVVLLLSGIERIPAYFYEDAELNGANALQKFWHVTLPLTWDIVVVAVVLWLIGAVRIFDFVFAFVGIAGFPPKDVATLSIAQYAVTTGGPSPAYDMGYGSAMGVFMVVLIGLLVVAVRRVMRRDAIEF
jgi:ABC-type sugar transport system permease subunit